MIQIRIYYQLPSYLINLALNFLGSKLPVNQTDCNHQITADFDIAFKYWSLQLPFLSQSHPIYLSQPKFSIYSLQKQIINKYQKPFPMISPEKYPFSRHESLRKLSSNHSDKDLTLSFRKKRIGCYSYHLDDCIGSGYSSRVYRGYKNDRKDKAYAIKAIKIADIPKNNYNLLQNEISILKELDHPNIIKLHDVFYTENNCYIITDFCEGGTLQSQIESKKNLDWNVLFHQLLSGCFYLEEKLIIHRDIKPANIFYQSGTWKIGDFGFARYLPYKNAQIKEMFTIGSPLYMPPQTLEKNIYSLKTDSFAFGILFFHLVTKEYPWSGKNKKELIENYSERRYPLDKLKNIPVVYQKFLKGLCEMEITRRYYITDFEPLMVKQSNLSENSTNLSHLSNEDDMLIQYSNEISLQIVERMKICKFMYYIDINIQQWPEMSDISENIKRMLKFLSIIFGWINNEGYQKYLDDFKCRNFKQFNNIGQLSTFYKVLFYSIEKLSSNSIRKAQILRVKLIQLLNIVGILILKQFRELKPSIDRLVLHSDFSKVLISPAKICQVEQLKKFSI